MAGQCREWRVTRIHSMHRRRLSPTRASRCHRLLQRNGNATIPDHALNWSWTRLLPTSTIPHWYQKASKRHQNVPKVESGDLRSLRNFKAALPLTDLRLCLECAPFKKHVCIYIHICNIYNYIYQPDKMRHWEKNGWTHFYPKRVQWNRKTKLWLLFCRVGFGYSTKNLGRKGWEESRKRWLFMREERMAKCRQRLPGADNFRLSCRCWRCKLIEEKHLQRSCLQPLMGSIIIFHHS